MNKTFLFLLIAILTISTIDFSHAQTRSRRAILKNRKMSTWRGQKSGFSKAKKYTYVGFSVNSMHYFGDLTPTDSRISTDLGTTRPGFGVHVGRRMGPRFSLEGAFIYGTLAASDFSSTESGSDDPSKTFRYVRNLHFRNRIKEVSGRVVFDLFENQAYYVNRPRTIPYAFIGVAAYYHNPQAKAPETDRLGNPLPEAGEWVDLRPLGTEGQFADLPDTVANHGIKPYSRFQISVPFGLGVRFRLNDVLDFSAEASIRYLFTDYIDDVSNNYVDLIHLDGELARSLSDRSLEATDAFTGEDRIPNPQVLITGSERLQTGPGGYANVPGFGSEFFANKRGNPDENDFYFVMSFKLTYILQGSFKRAKFR